MFEIKFMRPTNGNTGTLKATFTAAFKALELNDCKLVEGQNGLFFSPPSRPYEKDGQKKYANYFFVTDENLRRQIEEAAIAEYQRQQPQRPQGGGGQMPNYSEPPFNPDDDIPF